MEKQSIKDALISAVNHSGDSDSTGAIAGNILGAYLGYGAIPEEWINQIEMKEVIDGMVDSINSIIAI